MTQYEHFLQLAAIETDECVLWPYGQAGKTGYGKVKLRGKTPSTHSLALELRCPKPSPGRSSQAAHSCRHRHCMNYRHLSWKTPKANTADRKRDGTEVFGERVPNSKLTDDLVRWIRSTYAAGAMSQQSIADLIGVNQTLVSTVVRNAGWKHVS